ncbi:MAG: DUF2892 domain-containing protein [Bacteroidetes bacterium]|jgi:hypothetical protein|nr:DUF2892 domain-containing protein [Bacteroidota bacterium]
MKKNMGTIDRVLRIIAALVIMILYFTDQISGMVAIVLLIISAIFIFTSFISFCPLYAPFGLSTRKRSNRQF